MKVDDAAGVPPIGVNCPYDDGPGKLTLRNAGDRSVAKAEGTPPGEREAYGFAGEEVFWYCNGKEEAFEGAWIDIRSLNVEDESDACWFGRIDGIGWLEGSEALNGSVVVR